MTIEEIVRALGGRRVGRGWSARCPLHDDRHPSLSLWIDPVGKIAIYCHAGCPGSELVAYLRARGLWADRKSLHTNDSVAKVRSASSATLHHDTETAFGLAAAQRIWNSAIHPAGSVAEAYLAGRGLRLPASIVCRVLRFCSNCPFGHDRFPAVIGAFRQIGGDLDPDAPPIGIQRIGLTSDGSPLRDATGRKVKRMLGTVAGAAVKLSPDEEVEYGLGICEGIETGLAILASGWGPIWALGSAGAIARLPILPGITALTIFADHDPSGQAAAAACASRWQDEAEVRIVTPKHVGADWAEAG